MLLDSMGVLIKGIQHTIVYVIVSEVTGQGLKPLMGAQ